MKARLHRNHPITLLPCLILLAGCSERPKEDKLLAADRVPEIQQIGVDSDLAKGEATGFTSLENEFIRKPGHYVLDHRGSFISVTRDSEGSWSLRIAWYSSGADHPDLPGNWSSTTSHAPEDAIIADGWFVFVETPYRIWIFDGENNGELSTNIIAEKTVTSSAWYGEVMTACPQKVWDALPLPVREHWKKVVREWQERNGSL